MQTINILKETGSSEKKQDAAHEPECSQVC